ncbi:helix-turn-helix transcriptional regulator [Streptococcus sp. SO4]|uniref:helix-turn-helix domain-containing protein n=1 Tax=Streptococcus sp. SO4 TaxID=3018249 RepID=UPI00263F45C7|nr:helix-turn-helix transcriptional regulator [Streptococcus sp. SO4]MDN5024659.1 helix-turn-helix transcriptional regulator [Streptococcus sp. SO4]
MHDKEQLSTLLSSFLQVIKKKFGITSKLLANELEISKNTLTNWRKGYFNPNTGSIEKLYSYVCDFKIKYSYDISKDYYFSNLMEDLDNLLSIEFDRLLDESNPYKISNQKELLEERKSSFQKSFNNLIDFLSYVAKLFDSEYDENESIDLKLRGYQKREMFDKLLELKLITKNQNGRITIQKNLAKILNVSEAQISRWKNGNDYPSPGRLIQIGKLLGLNSDISIALREYKFHDFESMFIDSPSLSSNLEKFQQDYFNRIKKFIEISGYENNLESKIIEDNYLIFNDNEDLNEVQTIIFRDCIMLLAKAFEVTENGDGFLDWLYKKVQQERINILMHGMLGQKLDTVEYCYEFAEKIDDGYKLLNNYIHSGENFELVKDYILNNNSLFVLSKEFIDSFLNKDDFEAWFKSTEVLFKNKKFFRQQCQNICNSLNKRNEDNSQNYLEAFYNQFWTLILYKNKSVDLELNPIHKAYSEIGEKGISQNLEEDYSLLKNTLEKIYNDKNMKFEKGSMQCSLKSYLMDGEPIFEEILLNDSHLIFDAKMETSKDEFEIVEEKHRLTKKASDFQNKYFKD